MSANASILIQTETKIFSYLFLESVFFRNFLQNQIFEKNDCMLKVFKILHNNKEK